MKSDGRAILWILTGLSAILLAAILSWFFTNFERRTREVDTGYSAAARRNPFLAAERFLTRLGIPAESLAGRDLLRDLPPPEDTLVVNSLGALNVERQEALQRWIEGGGRLIVAAADPQDEDIERHTRRRDDFLDRFGIVLRRKKDAGNRRDPDDEAVASIGVEDYPHPVEVGFTAGYYLDAPEEKDASWEARGRILAADRLRLLQFDIGDGLLTVSSDNRFLTNRHIGQHDHALFLALIADPPGKGKVWLLYDSAMPWLGTLLWRRAPLALISALVLLCLFLWNLGGRLGPFLSAPAGDRRDLLAHLQASARFLWGHGQGGRLTTKSRERIEQAWLRHHPVLRELDQAGRAAWIGRRSGVAPGDVQRALYPSAVNEQDLVADTFLLQRLWSGLSAPGVAVAHPRHGLHASNEDTLSPATRI